MRRHRRSAAVASLAAACALTCACSSGATSGTPSVSPAAGSGSSLTRPSTSPTGAATHGPTSGAPATSSAPAAQPTNSAVGPTTSSPAQTVTLAFGGDTQAHGVAASINTVGLGATGQLLAAADIGMVNLETVVVDDASGLVAQPKQFTFVTDPRILASLQNAGVDVVTAANNHGMDYGAEGLRRMLVVKQRSTLPILGIGSNADQAYAPIVRNVRGRNVVIFGASDVLDPSLNWTATDTKPGMAYLDTPGGLERLEQGVKAARAADPGAAIVVYLHWGSERVRCPKVRQVEIATRLSAAGASVVVGSHAHIQQPTATMGTTAIAYGLGNFVFGSGSGDQRRTGVLTVTVPPTGTPTMTWSPAIISGGVPHLLSGAAKQDAIATFNNLDAGWSR